jgi:putative sterol carrier protein
MLFFTGKLDPTSAYMSGDLTMEGNLQVIMEYGSIAELLQEYLGFLTGEL